VDFSEEDLLHTGTAEYWLDPVTQTYYALATLDREGAALLYKQRLPEAVALAEGLLQSGQNHARAENYAAALADSAEGLTLAARAVTLAVQAQAIVPEASVSLITEEINRPLVVRARTTIRSVLDSISFEKAQGDGQWVAPGATPRLPFTVRLRATVSGRPVAEMPLCLEAPGGGAVTVLRATTDAEGMASFELTEPVDAGATMATVFVTVDLKAAAGEADLWDITAPGVVFECLLRSRDNTAVAVYIQESDPFELTTRAGIMTRAFEESLRSKGYRVLDPNDTLARIQESGLTPSSPDAEVAAAFSALGEPLRPGQFLLVAVGEARTVIEEVHSTSYGRLHIARCVYSMRVVDPGLAGEDKTILKVSGDGRGAYTDDPAEAAARARSNGLTEALEQLLKTLEARFGPVTTPD
jgi:hypothetical protein